MRSHGSAILEIQVLTNRSAVFWHDLRGSEKKKERTHTLFLLTAPIIINVKCFQAALSKNNQVTNERSQGLGYTRNIFGGVLKPGQCFINIPDCCCCCLPERRRPWFPPAAVQSNWEWKTERGQEVSHQLIINTSCVVTRS